VSPWRRGEPSKGLDLKRPLGYYETGGREFIPDMAYTSA